MILILTFRKLPHSPLSWMNVSCSKRCVHLYAKWKGVSNFFLQRNAVVNASSPIVKKNLYRLIEGKLLYITLGFYTRAAQERDYTAGKRVEHELSTKSCESKLIIYLTFPRVIYSSPFLSQRNEEENVPSRSTVIVT